MFSRLRGLAPAEWSSLSLSLSLFSRACIGSPSMYLFYFSYLLLRPRSLGMAMFVLHFLYLAGPYPRNFGNVWFTFSVCVIALYIYICLCVCGWLCTLYDRHSWLREWPSLVMRALDFVVWIYAQGDCCRCIFMLYFVHDHRGVIVLIHVTKWHWFFVVCNTYQHF